MRSEQPFLPSLGVPIAVTLGWLLLSPNGFAQELTPFDALLWSIHPGWSTAQSTALSQSASAAGMEASAVLRNPAGIALYEGYDIGFTTLLSGTQSTIYYLSKKNARSFYNFGLTNIHIVSGSQLQNYKGEPRTEGWNRFAWSMGMHRLTDWNFQLPFSGQTDSFTILKYFWTRAEGHRPNMLNPFDADLAYKTGLLTPVDSDSTRYTYPFMPGMPLTHQGNFTFRGSLSEAYIVLAGGYEDKLYLGVSIDVPFINYRQQFFLKETDLNDTVPEFAAWSYQTQRTTSGWGAGLRLGLLYQLPIPVRLGFFLESPRFLFLRDQFQASLSVESDSSGERTAASPEQRTRLRFVTPWRTGINLAIVFQPGTFVSAQYTFTDYRTMYFSSVDNAQTLPTLIQTNDQIVQTMNVSHSLRAGFSLTLDWFRIFGGGGIMTSPLNSQQGWTRLLVSGGIGVIEDDFYLDFGVVWTQWQFFLAPYPEDATPPPLTVNQTRLAVLITFGWIAD